MSTHVLVVGAGSMGLIVGYKLHLAGAKVTFLVRPHRGEMMKRDQVLYNFDEHELRTFRSSDYNFVTDPSEITSDYDFIYITLDTAALRNDTGRALVKTIGESARNSKVILGSVYIDLVPWFLEISGMSADQVTNGYLMIHAYPAQAVPQPGIKPELLEKADLVYTERVGAGISLDDSSPGVAKEFSDLYSKSGSSCTITPKQALSLNILAVFPILAACNLCGWAKFEKIHGEDWDLGLAAAKEIQRLGIHGEMGKQAAERPTAELTAAMVGYEKAIMPFDLHAFNKFHHGAKVSLQDRELLRACLARGEDEGLEMPALKEIIQRLEATYPY